MIITNTSNDDFDVICHLFDEAIKYQQRNHYPAWPTYDQKFLLSDIENKKQFKIVQDDQISCIFSICYSDRIIWRGRDDKRALYLHRIVTNPVFKGNELFKEVLSWAKMHAVEKGLDFIRMDTWADNPSIIKYYKQFGFDVVGNLTTPHSHELSVQQRGNDIVLLEASTLDGENPLWSCVGNTICK